MGVVEKNLSFFLTEEGNKGLNFHFSRNRTKKILIGICFSLLDFWAEQNWEKVAKERRYFHFQAEYFVSL